MTEMNFSLSLHMALSHAEYITSFQFNYIHYEMGIIIILVNKNYYFIEPQSDILKV